VSEWIILRTKARHTLPLAESLGKAGFEAWTPAKVEQRRVMRSRTRVEVRAPLLPNIVFARSTHVWELSSIANSERTQHPGFSLLHHLDRIPVIADSELNPLRWEEDRERLKEDRERLKETRKERRTFNRGQAVSTRAAGFEGMSGIVEKS
jgi:hypothetical protein